MNVCKCVTKNFAVSFFFQFKAVHSVVIQYWVTTLNRKKYILYELALIFFIFLIFYHIVVQSLC